MAHVKRLYANTLTVPCRCRLFRTLSEQDLAVSDVTRRGAQHAKGVKFLKQGWTCGGAIQQNMQTVSEHEVMTGSRTAGRGTVASAALPGPGRAGWIYHRAHFSIACVVVGLLPLEVDF